MSVLPLTEDELFADVENEEELLKQSLKSLNISSTFNSKCFEETYDDTCDYSEEEDYYDYYDDGDNYSNKQHNNQQQVSNKINKYQPSENLFKKYTNKINLERYEVSNLSSEVMSHKITNEKKLESDRKRIKDKHDRATVEQVMDPRTRMIIFKLLNQGVISEIGGCISTGKEANVYYASSSGDRDYAIKIYKTSILVFKDRDKYINGEFRFRHGYCKNNPRKMVKTWAEKEMRNLIRMYSNGVNVPEPVLLKSHVLLMTFLGKKGWPAPKLKDVELNQSKARRLYRDTVILMWKIYNKCKLVHADLSEFNMLYHNGEIYIIDVSQSVEHDHPHALEFLRKDCTNITDYFKKKGVATMGIKDLFDFITDSSINDDNMEDCLTRLSEKAGKTEVSLSEQVDEEVFKQAYIPKRLTEVIDFERDINEVKKGTSSDLILQDDQLEESGNSEDDSNVSGSEEDGDDDDEETVKMKEGRSKDETLEEKRARKKAVKLAQAEKRKTKIKKHLKKKKTKATKK
ncbi:hypothetical protein GWI33_015012 [Rhynchophorus ferrugineus]|uniref:Serine/threonine-protein kinase RIO1 n=1 Tax=Rhynchophorus ferrugineus TaxID=354439 RepID=A0A834I420_RHYFE|nr:hypothetical protein GWI33_015012 [Rhynchophorus ferrugineus]